MSRIDTLTVQSPQVVIFTPEQIDNHPTCLDETERAECRTDGLKHWGDFVAYMQGHPDYSAILDEEYKRDIIGYRHNASGIVTPRAMWRALVTLALLEVAA